MYANKSFLAKANLCLWVAGQRCLGFHNGTAQHVNFLTCYAYHIIWRSTFKEKSDSIIPQSVEDT